MWQRSCLGRDGDGVSLDGGVGSHEAPAWQGPPAWPTAWMFQLGCKAAAPVFVRTSKAEDPCVCSGKRTQVILLPGGKERSVAALMSGQCPLFAPVLDLAKSVQEVKRDPECKCK